VAHRRILFLAAVSILCVAGCLRASVYVQPDEGWTSYASTAGFSVLAPAPLSETVKVLNNPNLGPIETHFLVTTTPAGVRYAVVYGDFPASYLASTDVLGDSRDGDARSLKASATNEQRLTVSGRPALDYRIETTNNVRRERLVLDGARLYAVTVTGTAEAADGDDARKFLDSFALTGR
jgi:hypothetical protein